jgi:hypothetical protein
VFATADFLVYQTTEQELVDRVVMNLHSSILVHSAFLERPHSREELGRAIGLIEEKMLVAKARDETSPPLSLKRMRLLLPAGLLGRGYRRLNAGSVAAQFTSNVTADRDPVRRETGRRPEEFRPPGAKFELYEESYR